MLRKESSSKNVDVNTSKKQKKKPITLGKAEEKSRFVLGKGKKDRSVSHVYAFSEQRLLTLSSQCPQTLDLLDVETYSLIKSIPYSFKARNVTVLSESLFAICYSEISGNKTTIHDARTLQPILEIPAAIYNIILFSDGYLIGNNHSSQFLIVNTIHPKNIMRSNMPLSCGSVEDIKRIGTDTFAYAVLNVDKNIDIQGSYLCIGKFGSNETHRGCYLKDRHITLIHLLDEKHFITIEILARKGSIHPQREESYVSIWKWDSQSLNRIGIYKLCDYNISTKVDILPDNKTIVYACHSPYNADFEK